MPYPGGKGGAGVYQTIINGMPRHEVYVEPFLGGGAVMAAKRPACLNIGVDLNRAT
jgi:DNA adenine methylase